MNVQSVTLREHILMQIPIVTPVISRITLRLSILTIQPWDSRLHAICVIPWNRDGNRQHLQNMTISHFQFIPENIKAHGRPALSVIRIPRIILNSHACHAMNITRPTWITSTGKREVIPITVQPAFIVIQGEQQKIEKQKMKSIIVIYWIFFALIELKGQPAAENLIGKVSFVSSQNIYVKFKSTSGI